MTDLDFNQLISNFNFLKHTYNKVNPSCGVSKRLQKNSIAKFRFCISVIKKSFTSKSVKL